MEKILSDPKLEPHFPEASTTVGKGRAILESGYTFTNRRRDDLLRRTVP
jgi:hypothetical protein